MIEIPATDYSLLTYGLYILTAVPITLFVARTLSRNGKHFLIDVFHGNDSLADAVNQLLVVGFYLLNLGFVSFFLKSAERIESYRVALEVLSTKVGTVAIVIGVVHFANVWAFNKYRNRAIDLANPVLVPVDPTGSTATSWVAGA
jgi:hypothetical protein